MVINFSKGIKLNPKIDLKDFILIFLRNQFPEN
jgi:hypothetical protein